MKAEPDVLLDQKFDHPEGLVWDERGERLLWVDIFRGGVLSYAPASRAFEQSNVGRSVGAVAPRSGGGLVCAVREGFAFLSEAGSVELVTELHATHPDLRMNDGAVDARGRFWAGSMSDTSIALPGEGALYRFDPDRACTTHLEGVAISNGIGWSSDNKICYYIDSASHGIDAFDFDLEAGRLSDRRQIAKVEVYPDGLAIDAEGCVWVAMFGGGEVCRFTPSGRIDRVVRLPGTQVTTCAFGGRDLRTLFIAVSPHGLSEQALRTEKAGYIFAMDVDVPGLPAHEFGG